MAENFSQNSNALELKNVILATDFLENSRLALDYAVAFSHRFGSTLTLLHILELPLEAEEAELVSHRSSVSRETALVRLEAFAAGVRRLGITTKVDLRIGDPCPAVVKAAAEDQCGLLVIGTHGIYRGLEHLILGSNAEKILLSAPCPTLTIGRHVLAGVDLDLKFRDILIVSDLTPESVNAASYALELGLAFGIPVDFMHIGRNDPSRTPKLVEKLAAQYCEILARHPAAVDPKWCSPQYHLERFCAADDVIHQAERSRSTLIVSGVHHTSRAERHLHGSFAFELAARAFCPLLTVPSKGN